MLGHIKWYSAEKGFGFIQDDDEIDYFVHFSELSEGYLPLVGSVVEFEPEETDRGWKAISVRAVNKGI